MAAALYCAAPVEAALKNAIRSLGETLYALGQTTALYAACNRLEAMRPGQVSWRGSVLNAAWDEIGSWRA
jgi:hypothetical protein